MVRFSTCYQNGYNPFLDFENNNECFKAYPCPYIYPRFALFVPIIFGIDETNVVYFCFLQLIFFVFFVFTFLEFNTLKKSIINTVILISPAILLLLERANFDLIIFIILMFSFFILGHKIKFKFDILLRYLLVLFVALIKIFPVVLLVLIFFEKFSLKNKFLLCFILIALFLGYNLYHIEDFKMISKYMTSPSELAFGRKILLQEFIPIKYLNLISFVPVLFFVIYFFYKKNNFSKSILGTNLVIENLSHRMFVVGALIYIFTYFSANNYDYKFVFLIFTIPYLFDNHKTKKIKMFFLILFIISLYSSSLHRYFIPFKSYTQWFIGRNFLMIIKYLSTTILCSFFIVHISKFFIDNLIILRDEIISDKLLKRS